MANLKHNYFAFGEHDIVGIVDLPDNVAANASLRTHTTVLLTVEEVDRALATDVGYHAPGRFVPSAA